MTKGGREAEVEGSENIKWTTEPTGSVEEGEPGRLKDNEAEMKTTNERRPRGQRLGAMTQVEECVGI